MSKPLTGMAKVLRSIEDAKVRRAAALAMQSDGKTLEEIGAKLGVSRQRAAVIVAKAKQEAQP